MRYFIEFEYNGARYHGWQYQPNALSVQEEMEKALAVLLRQPTPLTAAGRTDTGVHAKQMFAHFDTEAAIDPNTVALKLNGLLPQDIAIHRILPVTPDAHARFSATSRTYEYYLCSRKNAFTDKQVTRTHFKLDYEKMNQAAQLLLGRKDFASFCKAHTDVKTTICDVKQAYWRQLDEHTWVFTIRADRFLRNMVRATVGTLIEVGRGLMQPEDIPNVLAEKHRCAAGQSMPADGLYLVEIRYPESIFATE